ncbi:kinase-like domain-containing protein [Mycena pura]|uniref:Kinase-like domain-containing protein n=1 Tax=Mycena pura TaxID=153505 RepID=A0AAD6Y4P3_9AGAR|nr:kinase-like domain-containing protein [Mycena pura]
MIDPFVFNVVEDMEEGKDYGPGGLFPVKLGDVLGPEGSMPRYRISAKLGHGSYSTVWLARDLVARRTVAVKIVRASEYATSREAAILKRLRSPASDPPAVIQLLDSFTLTSVNGIHHTLVTEPVIPLERLLKLPGIQVNTRSLVRQALEGLAFIHERGIAHGGESPVISNFLSSQPLPDIYPSNIGVVIPDLDSFSEVDIWDKGGAPTIVPLVTYNPAHDAASFPPYLTHARPRGTPHAVVSLLSFPSPLDSLRRGHVAYFAEETPSPPCHSPLVFTAPEVAFPMMAHDNDDAPWDRRADIWAMGCTMCQIAGGGIPFGHFSNLLHNIAALCGGAPADWTTYLASLSDKPKAYTPEASAALWAARVEHLQRGGRHSAEDAHALVKLLRRMLVVDPMERPSASALLQDPYFDLAPDDHGPLSG